MHIAILLIFCCNYSMEKHDLICLLRKKQTGIFETNDIWYRIDLPPTFQINSILDIFSFGKVNDIWILTITYIFQSRLSTDVFPRLFFLHKSIELNMCHSGHVRWIPVSRLIRRALVDLAFQPSLFQARVNHYHTDDHQSYTESLSKIEMGGNRDISYWTFM